MRLPCPLGLLLLLSALAAHATDDMLLYSDRFNNGWVDNWSWMPRHATNNPVYSGSTSMACVPSDLWQAWWLKSGTSVDTTPYTNVSFWLNGGATGGQSVLVSGELGGSGMAGIWVTASTNTWKPFTISLTALGINNKSNLTGFQLGNGTSTQPFFIDDMRLVAAPTPAMVQVNVLATQSVRKVDGKVFGINQVAWDGNVNTSATAAVMNDIGATCLRWPGGSWGDGYHWTNEAWNAGATDPRFWGSFSKDFIALATNTHAQAFIIVNYGTSGPEEAAYGVRMFNLTNHCNFKYWEIGNEVGGSWEWDWNTNAPFKAHDPWTYAMRFTNYYAQMKAADPTIKIGAVADTTEDGTVNNNDHPVVNPRTGQTHYGWTPVMLTYLRSNNCIPDFLIEHNYGPTAGDTQDLLWSKGWAADAVNLRQMLKDYVGNAGTNVTLEITENGMGGDKQDCSLPGGLFYADSIGQILQTEFNSRLWWDMRNGGNSLTDADPAFYGWRTDSSGNFISDAGLVYGLGGVGSAYPTYYVAKLLPHFAAEGDTVVSATSDYPLLAVYSVKRTNGNLSLLVINKSSASNLTAAINLSGYVPYTNATVYSYGIAQDEAARLGVGSPDIAQTSFAGVHGSFSATFAPFSATVMVLSAADATPGLRALYAFEGNAQDTSGNGFDGTATALNYVAGKVGAQAGQFNGSSSYVLIPRSITDDFTVALWVKTTDTAGTAGAQWWSGKGLVDGEVGGGGADWGTAIVNGKFVLGVGSIGGDTTIASSVTINDGTWHHLAATRSNSSGAMQVYVDGALRGSGTGPTGSRTFPPSLRLGSLQTANNFLNGTLDDVRLYDRVLSTNEIAALLAPPAAPAGLAAVAADGSVALNWSASSTATNYFVKRSTTSGSGYTSVATNASLAFTNAGLVNGTLYYFAVSALNGFGESTNSPQVSARPTSSAPVAILATSTSGQLGMSWPADHTGWELQSQTNSPGLGLSTNWINVTGSAQINQLTLPLSTANGSVFFRLVRPY
jgi:alpha-L-arabinofuranosidase